MAEEYYEKLSALINKLDIQNEISQAIEIKHFFSGAALFVNKTICVSWSPSGLAFKLAEKEVNELIASEQAIPLKYFPKGHIKKGYAVFVNPSKMTSTQLIKYFIKAAEQV